MALTAFYAARFRAVDANGDPIPGAILSFFEAGTATPLAVYSDVDGTVPLGVTVTADAGGLFAEIFMLPQAYDITLTTSAGVSVWTAVDWFPPQAASSANVDQTWTAGVTFAAGEGAYLSDGSGGLNAGQAYKWDADLAYASDTPETGFAVAAIAAGASGLFRTAGQVTGLVGLTPGALYFISGTAGAITTTPGAFPRLVGQALSTTVLAVQTNPPLSGGVDHRLKSIVNGRLTLTTGTPVTTADVTAAGTLYFTPYQGNQVALFTGTRWVVVTFAQLSIAAPAVATQMYDVFLDYNDGTPALVLLAWTNDTTRATALTTQDGVYVKTGDTQQRYLGSVRTVTASQFNDSAALRHVNNYYNRVPRLLEKLITTDNYTYTTNTIRQWEGSAANQVSLVTGVAEDVFELEAMHVSLNSSADVSRRVGIGEGSTTAMVSSLRTGGVTIAPVSAYVLHRASLRKVPAVGYQFYAGLEVSSATGTTTWTGDDGSTSGVQSGLSGWVWG